MCASVGDRGHRLEHLVDLLLVLDDRVRDLRVVQHEDEFGGRRVLVHRHGDAAQRLRGRHRPIESRPVVADDREPHPPLESLRGEPAGERAHLGGDLPPRPRLPDAEVLFAKRGMASANFGVMEQQAREGVQRRRCVRG